MRIRILLVAIMTLCLCAQTSAKIFVADQISLPIKSYYGKDGNRIALHPFGELLIELRYADTFSYSANNSYSIFFRGFSDSSRNMESLIFRSYFSGSSQHEVDRDSWGGITWMERMNCQGIKHLIEMSSGVRVTRCAFHHGTIAITSGRLHEDGTSDGKDGAIIIDGGEETWNKLVKFLRNAHNHNIGKTI